MANQILKGARVHHIALRVSSMEESKRFYCEGLGLRDKANWLETDGGKACMLEIGDGGILELFDSPREALDAGYDRRAGQFFHVAIAVDDVDKSFIRALEYGAAEKTAPKDVSIPATPPLPVRLAFVYGPSGECIELFKEY